VLPAIRKHPDVWEKPYRDRHGQPKTVNKYWVEVRDHRSIVRRFPAVSDKAKSRVFGQHVQDLIACRVAGQKADADLIRWLDAVPARVKQRFVQADLVDPVIVQAGKPLAAHVEDFRSSLSRGRTGKHVQITCRRIQSIFHSCGFRYYSDITGSKVQAYLNKLTVSDKTCNYYLTAVKQFCRWMVLEQRASGSAVEHLKRLPVLDDEFRRALSFDEVCSLLRSAEAGPVRFGMTGHERAVLYLVAIETGLRVNELRSLQKRSFDFDNCIVTCEASYCKNRRAAEQILKSKRAEQLRNFLAGKLPTARAFNMPSSYRTAPMLRADLQDAGIAYVDERGLKADFHSLRHTLATELDRTGASLKERMAIMRHSDRGNLTQGVYTHAKLYDLRRAIEDLPDHPWPGGKESASTVATGTDNRHVTVSSDLAQNLPGLRAHQCSCVQHHAEATIDNDTRTAFSNGPGRIQTYDRWIDCPQVSSSHFTSPDEASLTTYNQSGHSHSGTLLVKP